MGNGIAHVFAQFGNQVNLIDVKQESLDKAIITITKNLDRQVSKGTLTEEAKQKTLANISTHTDLASALKDSAKGEPEIKLQSAVAINCMVSDSPGCKPSVPINALKLAAEKSYASPYTPLAPALAVGAPIATKAPALILAIYEPPTGISPAGKNNLGVRLNKGEVPVFTIPTSKLWLFPQEVTPLKFQLPVIWGVPLR